MMALGRVKKIPAFAGMTVLAVTVLLLASCGTPPPPPPVLTLNIMGSAGQNPDAGGHGTTVAVQLYQLAATGKFQSTDVYSLMNQETAVLGSDEMGSSEPFLVAPGARLSETRALKPMVTSVGLAVLFRDINHSVWKLVAPVAANGPSVVTLRIDGLTATLGN
jgi:type VI secretion system protein VasD